MKPFLILCAFGILAFSVSMLPATFAVAVLGFGMFIFLILAALLMGRGGED